MCKVENKENTNLSDMKHKLEDDIVVTEKHLAELRMATDKKTEVEMGKTRRLGLEVISSLASVRNNFILFLNFQLSSNERCVLEKVAAKSIEWGMDLNQSRKAELVDWRYFAHNWLRIVSSIENVTEESCHKEVDSLVISTILRDLVGLESEISLHLEFVLSGRFQPSDQDNRLAIRHIQEYEDRLNSAQGNRVYQRHGHRSKSVRVKNGECAKVNHRVKYERSKTAELPNLSKTTEVTQIGLRGSKSDSSVKLALDKLNTNNKSSECHEKTRQRKTSFLDQVSHMFRNIL